jgi:putative holliday junction resolvase
MLLGNLTDLKGHLQPGQRLLGLDVGQRTIGVAMSDTLLMIATPHSLIRRGRFATDAAAIAAIAAKEGVGGIVIGLPVNMDGSEGPRCQSARQFRVNLHRLLPLPMAMWDERWSTQAVTRTLLAADASRKRRAELVDKLAAAYILQGALDRLSHS